MSTHDGGERDEELLRRYRQASQVRPAAPSAATRAAILAQGREAAAHYEQAPAPTAEPEAAAMAMKSAPRRRPGWIYAVLGTASAAVLAGILVLPRFMQHPEQIAQVPAAAPQDVTAEAPQGAPAALPSAQMEVMPSSAAPAGNAARADTAAAAPALALKEETSSDKKAEAERRAPAAQEEQTYREAAPPSLAKSAAAAPAPATQPARQRDESKHDSAQPSAELSASGDDSGALLWDALNARDLPRLRELIAAGVQLEATDAQGRTPLMLATLRGQTDAVAALLQGGANPNAVDQAGHTPLATAMRTGRTDIVALLQKAGAR
jgi:hypothetical protein